MFKITAKEKEFIFKRRMVLSNIMNDPKFMENLDAWLFKSEQKNAEYIKKVKNDIPNMFTKYDGVLYRGMTVDQSFIDQLDKGIVFKNITSWTKDKKIALKFIDDPKYNFTKGKGIKVLLKKKIPNKIIMDIYNFILFTGGVGLDELNYDSALKEQEVIVDAGVKINKKDITLL